MTRAELMRHALPQALTQSRWEILMAALWDFKLLRPFDFVVYDLARFLERLPRTVRRVTFNFFFFMHVVCVRLVHAKSGARREPTCSRGR